MQSLFVFVMVFWLGSTTCYPKALGLQTNQSRSALCTLGFKVGIVSAYIYIYVCMYVCMYVCIYLCIYTYESV